MPVYNVEKYLSEAIESIVKQTYTNWELILVNDCSPDNSGAICDEFAGRDNRIKVVHLKHNVGLSAARNAGLDVAEGDFFTFVDSDDCVSPETYENVLSVAIERNADIVMFSHDHLLGNELKPVVYGYGERETFESRSDIEAIALAPFGVRTQTRDYSMFEGSVCFAVFHKKFNIDFGLRFTADRLATSEDYIYKFEAMQHAGKVEYIPKAFYHYRQNPMSSCRKPDLNFLNRIVHASLVAEDCFKRYGINDAETYAMNFCIAAIRGYLKPVLLSDIPKRKQRLWLKQQAENPYLQKVYACFPWQNLPFKHRLGFKYFYEGRFWRLYLLVVGQETARRYLPGIFKS